MPCGWEYEDILGHVVDVCGKFKVMNACGSNSSHRYIGNLGCTDDSPAKNIFLNVRIAYSAALM